MILDISLGAPAMWVSLFLVGHARRQELSPRWWQWALTALGILYGVFVIELVGGFLAEGSLRAALVMGLITGVVAVIWGVLLGRFVFAASAAKTIAPAGAGDEE